MKDKRKRIANFTIAFTLALGFAVLIIFVFIGLSAFRDSLRFHKAYSSTALMKNGDVASLRYERDRNGWRTEYRDVDGKLISDNEIYTSPSYTVYHPAGYLFNCCLLYTSDAADE